MPQRSSQSDSKPSRKLKGVVPQEFQREIKEDSNYGIYELISHASKVILKILQARLQQYVNWELTDVQAGFRKGRGTRDQIGNIRWIIEKAREFQKNIYFCFIDYTKAFDCVSEVKVAQSCLTLFDSMEFSRPEYWSG